MLGNDVRRIRSEPEGLEALLVQPQAVLADRQSAGSLPHIVRLDVVALCAPRVVVMNAGAQLC